MIQIKSVENSSDLKKFIDFPWEIYKADPHWVPPLKIAIKDLIDPKKNPFFKHAKIRTLLALNENEKVVGRVLGSIDDNHNSFHGEKVAFFGFYESENNVEITKALLDDLSAWARENGMTALRGPVNLSTNNECGLLVEGFDDSPQVMMTYNPKYYETLFEEVGLVKAKDLYAYFLKTADKFRKVIYYQCERLKRKSKIVMRPFDMKKFDEEVERVLQIYNDAWEKNWGFVPMTREEFHHMAKDMKLILDPNLAFIAEVDGEPAGFSLSLPDVNQVFAKVKNGKLLPFGIFKLLWNLKGPGRKSTINRCRILTLGTKQKFRDLGLGPLFYVETYSQALKLGYVGGEASWVLEDNNQMNRALEKMCGNRTKVYRIYEMET